MIYLYKLVGFSADVLQSSEVWWSETREFYYVSSTINFDSWVSTKRWRKTKHVDIDEDVS